MSRTAGDMTPSQVLMFTLFLGSEILALESNTGGNLKDLRYFSLHEACFCTLCLNWPS